jgi:hypothetical protein
MWLPLSRMHGLCAISMNDTSQHFGGAPDFFYWMLFVPQKLESFFAGQTNSQNATLPADISVHCESRGFGDKGANALFNNLTTVRYKREPSRCNHGTLQNCRAV